MIDNKFIYSLVFNGSVFYIGCSKDLVKRYSAHINSAKIPTTETSKKIRRILDSGHVPEMKIIDYLPTIEAEKLEKTLIKCFYDAGQPITNYQLACGHKYDPYNIPNEITIEVMMKTIKYNQGAYLHQWAQRKKLYNLFEYPDNPF